MQKFDLEKKFPWAAKHEPELLRQFVRRIRFGNGSDACWDFTYSRTGEVVARYGQFSMPSLGPIGAHLVAFLFAYGELPSNYGLHECDRKSCVRPDHIFNGTLKENAADRDNKGRAGWQRDPIGWKKIVAKAQHASIGKTKPPVHAKLSSLQVRVIRSLAARGITYRELGLVFSIDPHHVYRIVKRRSWST